MEITLSLSFKRSSTKYFKKEIVKGKSISLCFIKNKIYSSAIVGGILPIAVGTALVNKKE